VSPLPNLDLASRARVVQAVSWSLFPGIGMGLALGFLGGMKGGLGLGASILLALFSAFLFTAASATVALLIAEGGGWMAARWSHPNSVPYRYDHSGARALIARGEIEKGVLAFQAAIAAHPQDAVPYTELARIHRDQLGQPEAALQWFRKARDLGKPTPGETAILMREILELARKHLHNPLRVAPDLAWYGQRLEGTSEAAWARRELAELKATIEIDAPGPTREPVR
jgi:hypothetical protein